MSNQLVAFMFGIGFGGWIYAMMMRRSGGNAKNSLIVAALAGLVGAFVVYTLLAMVLPAPKPAI